MPSPASSARGDNRGSAAATAPLPRISRPAGGGDPRLRSVTRRGPAPAMRDSPVPFVTPFLVQASCELSEDYFLTCKVLVNTGDVVRPFAHAGRAVEARSLLRNYADTGP